LHKREDLNLLNGKGFIFNGAINDSYIIEYQMNEDCPSHYKFDNIQKTEIKFEDATLGDLIAFGKKYFRSDDAKFQIEFNNEIVYELADEEKNTSKEFYGNINLMSVKDVKLEDGKFLKIRSLHSLSPGSAIAKKLSKKKLTELKIPYNDIIVLRKDEEEVQLEFEPMEIFKS
ncbi:MAG: hypothetical protein ABI528_11515, partial [bacterium]